ncbi:MAG: hypothetical protein AAFN08_15975, partial [Cyanobacteria bacterium J06559_3]
QIIEVARDLVRAHRRELPLAPFLSALENALLQLGEGEFDEWCMEVDRIVAVCMGDREINEMHRIEWDYSAHFYQNLTRQEGADQLYAFLNQDAHPETIPQ